DEEMPVRRVRLDGFWMSKYEVQVDEYLQFTRETGGNLPEWLDESNYYHYQKGQDDHYRKLGEALTGGNYPIVGVSWHDAVAFTIWLSRESGKNYRLPSEAEWEYACRGGGHPIKYAWGSGEPYVDKNRAANIADNSMRHAFPRLVIWNGYEDGYTYTAPVGSFAANSLGLHDMTGNVWEWVLDVFDEQAYRKSGSDNPIFTSPSGSRAVRGGSWDDSSRDLRCSARDDDNPTDRDYNAGFRIVRTK
ncbi:MAG: SUMF1/EgtB/PvdO family nonheme iron enzyme, partial [SAR324 cluster bacterium]|nr:SUMF1/EgtB/PvdO family nonheme iron enzyme [SAR324 cluster bacterium]